MSPSANKTAAERDASIAKMMAEADAALAAAEESRASARNTEALMASAANQVQETAYRTEQARIEAEVAAITLAKIQRLEKLEKVGDLYHHCYTFDEVVTDRSVRQCTATLTAWSRSDPGCDIKIVLNTPGGDIVAGFNLIDFVTDMRARGHNVTTVALGMAASMGAAILQSGDTRVMGKNAVLLLHEGSLTVEGDFGSAEDTMRLMHIFHDNILQLFADRAMPINPKTTKEYLRRAWKRTDYWLDSARAVELGIADRIQ